MFDSTILATILLSFGGETFYTISVIFHIFGMIYVTYKLITILIKSYNGDYHSIVMTNKDIIILLLLLLMIAVFKILNSWLKVNSTFSPFNNLD